MSRHLKDLKPTETEDNDSRQPIDDLILLDKIGKGVSGEVWRAKPNNIKKEFAAKVLNFDNPLNRERAVMNEARLTRKLRHDHVVECHGLYENDDNFVVLYELAKGGSLAEQLSARLRMARSFSEKETASIIRQITEALKYIHGKNVMHRDVKPENIFFKDAPDHSSSLSEHTICLGDFGFAHESKDNKASDIMGPPSYIAPEVLLSPGYTEKVDMWSLGAITYELLSGMKPFSGKDDNETLILEKVKKDPIVLTGERWTHISDDAKDFVNSCLNRVPTERMSAKEAIEHRWLKKYANSSSGNRKKGKEVSSHTTNERMKPSGSTTSPSAANQKQDTSPVPAPAGSSRVATGSDTEKAKDNNKGKARNVGKGKKKEAGSKPEKRDNPTPK